MLAEDLKSNTYLKGLAIKCIAINKINELFVVSKIKEKELNKLLKEMRKIILYHLKNNKNDFPNILQLNIPIEELNQINEIRENKYRLFEANEFRKAMDWELKGNKLSAKFSWCAKLTKFIQLLDRCVNTESLFVRANIFAKNYGYVYPYHKKMFVDGIGNICFMLILIDVFKYHKLINVEEYKELKASINKERHSVLSILKLY